MAKIEINYLAHLSTAAGNRIKEQMLTDARTVRDLIWEIDRRSPGFARLMIDLQTNDLVHNNSVLLRRAGGLTAKVTALDTPIMDDDTLTFW